MISSPSTRSAASVIQAYCRVNALFGHSCYPLQWQSDVLGQPLHENPAYQPLIAGFRCQSEGRRQGYKAEQQGSEQTIVLKGVSGLNVQNQSAGEFLPRFQELLIVRQDNHEKEFRKSPVLCAAGPSSFAGCDRISSSLEPCSLVIFDAIGGADPSSLGHCYLPMLGILEACLLE